METYLFKFSACLAIFWLVYILFLERQTMHRFKRFYLLGTVVVSLIIPELRITEYIEPVVTNFEVSPVFIPLESSLDVAPVQAPFWDLETILWIIYGLGVVLFSLRFIVNLFRMYQRISQNETITKRSFIYVLLEECRIPHSFFKYLFFDKSKYETNAIPHEVILHEETHAKQLHSLDIIIIELLQIVFWFHPLIYILKHHIKLNHEFLADQAVLAHGADTKSYQNLLLQFSSNTKDYQLSSAINYSSIKKRFTVMKTQTSKTRIWISSLLLLPIIAILFYSFAEKEYVEKAMSSSSHSINDQYPRSIELKILNNNSYQVDGINATKKTFIEVFNQLHQDITHEQRNRIINIHISSPNEISNKEIWFVYNSLLDYGFYRIVTPNQEINREKGITPFAIENSLSTQQNEPTEKEVAAYNSWAKKIHSESKKLSDDATFFPPINEQDFYKFSEIYKRMSPQQIYQSVAYPFYGLDVETSEQQIATKKQVAEYNAWANKMNVAIKKAEAAKNKSAYPIIKKKEYDKYYEIYSNLMSDEQRKNAEAWPNIPPPPPPPPPAPKKTKGDPNAQEIEPIEIFIDKDDQIELNGKKTEINNINKEVKKLNQHLSKDDHRKYVMASIILEKNKSLDIAKTIQKKLREVEVWSSSVGYSENQNKVNLPNKHFSPYSGLTIEEAKEKEKKMLSEPIHIDTSKNSPWKIKVGTANYEFVDNNGKKSTGEISPPPPPPPTNFLQNNNEGRKSLNEIMKETPTNVESGYEILDNGETHYYTIYNGEKTYYNKDGYITDDKGNVLPPPPPESTLDFVIRMAKADAKFFNEGKAISTDEAIALIKANNKLNINAKEKGENGIPLVYITKKPILLGKEDKD